MSSRRQRSIPLGGRYRKVSLYKVRKTWPAHIQCTELGIIIQVMNLEYQQNIQQQIHLFYLKGDWTVSVWMSFPTLDPLDPLWFSFCSNWLVMLGRPRSCSCMEPKSLSNVPWHSTLQWRRNECDDVSYHRRLHRVLHCWFRHWSKKTSKAPRHWLCAGNSPVAGEFPAQKASDAENVSIWRRHHDDI